MIATAFFWTVMVVWIVLYLGFLSMECDTSLKSHKKMTVKKFIIELIIILEVNISPTPTPTITAVMITLIIKLSSIESIIFSRFII